MTVATVLSATLAGVELPQPFHNGIDLCYAIWRKHVCRDVSRIEQRFLHLLNHNSLDLIEADLRRAIDHRATLSASAHRFTLRNLPTRAVRGSRWNERR